MNKSEIIASIESHISTLTKFNTALANINADVSQSCADDITSAMQDVETTLTASIKRFLPSVVYNNLTLRGDVTEDFITFNAYIVPNIYTINYQLFLRTIVNLVAEDIKLLMVENNLTSLEVNEFTVGGCRFFNWRGTLADGKITVTNELGFLESREFTA